MASKRRYGWIRSLPDLRDGMFRFLAPRIRLPKSVDLRRLMPPVWDQGNLGACTAHGTGAVVQYTHAQAGLENFAPSRLFIYYEARAREGTINEDAGASVRDAMRVVNQQGFPHEKIWPYTISKFTRKPPNSAYLDGAKHRATTYHAVNNTSLLAMKTALAQGKPIVGGFAVYESFESAKVTKTGIVPLPGLHESMLGGHCVALVGYDDAKHWFVVRNSWGKGWGDKGYCYMPYDYWTNSDLAADCWIVNVVT